MIRKQERDMKMGRINEPAVHQVVKNTIRFSCPVVKQCGGCQFEDSDYGAQLAAKQKRVERLLGSFCHVEPILGMENPFYYRNKIHAAFDTDRKGNVISGVYAEGTHRVIPVKECLLENRCADKIIGTIKRLLVSFRLKAYDEDRRVGFLRHVLIRTGHTTGEIMVVLVAGTPVFPSKNNFVKALRREHPEITTIVLNINSRKTSMVLGEREQVLYGRGFILDTLCGMQFAISPKSFYQINPVQTEVLYRTAISMADLTGSERILDAYCGIGTIGLLASRQAKEVLGVEVNQDAVRNAISNAKQNGVKNVRFFEKDAGLFMRKLAAEGRKVDVVFLDPPRAGSDEMFLNSLAVLRPERVVYISCNPVTLARDLKYLTGRGYGVMRAVPVDMFPGTGHVESVVLMSRVQK